VGLLRQSVRGGGSCFIKDARSLSHQLQTAGTNATLVNETYLANKRQLELFIGRAETEAKLDWSGKTVALIGLSFKQDTNDTRNSPSINIVNFLLEHKVKEVKLYDPVAMDMFKQIHPASIELIYTSSEVEALHGADVVIISTDWPQFRNVADLILLSANRPVLLMDGRRLLQHRYDELRQAGANIIAVGSPFLPKKS